MYSKHYKFTKKPKKSFVLFLLYNNYNNQVNIFHESDRYGAADPRVVERELMSLPHQLGY